AAESASKFREQRPKSRKQEGQLTSDRRRLRMISQNPIVMPTGDTRIGGRYRLAASALTFARKRTKSQRVAIVAWFASAMSVCAASTVQFVKTPIPISVPEDW